ncbi:MAG: hypothetical protein DCC67_18745 [Planctomycetota bacterium]|nr:MAG: hypothetical protein DCC67_18745 [Planctomycetota bacterium]
MKPARLVALTLLLLSLSPNISPAGLIILGNLPATNDASGTSVDAGIANDGLNPQTNRPAISFTMPTRAYPLQHVALRFRGYNTAAGDAAEVGLYLDNGNDLPGTLGGSLLISPSSGSNAAGQFNFVPSTPISLAASTKYWVMISATYGSFEWAGSAPSIAPTSQVGVTFGKPVFFVGDLPRDATGVRSFEIVTSVPEPAMATFMFAAACSLAASRRLAYGSIT